MAFPDYNGGHSGGTDPNTGENPWTMFNGTDANGPPGNSPTGYPGTNAGFSHGGGGGGGAPASGGSGFTPGGFDPQNIIFSQTDGHFYAFKRSIGANGVYGYETVDVGQDPAAIASATGIPAGVLPSLM